jgi:hypothetical protein
VVFPDITDGEVMLGLLVGNLAVAAFLDDRTFNVFNTLATGIGHYFLLHDCYLKQDGLNKWGGGTALRRDGIE